MVEQRSAVILNEAYRLAPSVICLERHYDPMTSNVVIRSCEGNAAICCQAQALESLKASEVGGELGQQEFFTILLLPLSLLTGAHTPMDDSKHGGA